MENGPKLNLSGERETENEKQRKKRKEEQN